MQQAYKDVMMLINNSGFHSIDSCRNWCANQFNQEETNSNKINHFLNMIWRIVTVPFFAIATAFSEAFSLIGRSFSWCKESSPIESIEQEYSRLCKLHTYSADLFKEARNYPSRNRYRDILPNEPTRFKLTNEPNFYFNANWTLNGKAIACQGPLAFEISEFWKMVCHADVNTIVMLANPIESGREKCSEYWKSQTFSEKVVFENQNEKIVERSIEISNGRNKKIITQYHLQNWPDFGVVDTKTLGELVKLVSKKSNNTKILVHCSAGVGRTGTFLAAYQAFMQKTKNIFAIAADLRDPNKGRADLISTPEQYLLAKETAKILLG